MSRTAALGFSSLQSVCTNPYSIYRGPPFCKPPRLTACAPDYAEEPRHESPRHRRKNRRLSSPIPPFPQISKTPLPCSYSPHWLHHPTCLSGNGTPHTSHPLYP